MNSTEPPRDLSSSGQRVIRNVRSRTAPILCDRSSSVALGVIKLTPWPKHFDGYTFISWWRWGFFLFIYIWFLVSEWVLQSASFCYLFSSGISFWCICPVINTPERKLLLQFPFLCRCIACCTNVTSFLFVNAVWILSLIRSQHFSVFILPLRSVLLESLFHMFFRCYL